MRRQRCGKKRSDLRTHRDVCGTVIMKSSTSSKRRKTPPRHPPRHLAKKLMCAHFPLRGLCAHFPRRDLARRLLCALLPHLSTSPPRHLSPKSCCAHISSRLLVKSAHFRKGVLCALFHHARPGTLWLVQNVRTSRVGMCAHRGRVGEVARWRGGEVG